MRGKAGKKIEIGAKFDASVDGNNFTRLEYISFDAYKPTKLQGIIDAYFKRTGHYPASILADQIYSTRTNRKYCKEKAGKPLGRPKQDIEVERKFSQLKHKCDIGRITKRLKETTLHCLALSIFVQNLKKIFCALIQCLQNSPSRAYNSKKRSTKLVYQRYTSIAVILLCENEPLIQ